MPSNPNLGYIVGWSLLRDSILKWSQLGLTGPGILVGRVIAVG